MKKIIALPLASLVVASTLSACTSSDSTEAQDDNLTIFATTGYLADAAANIAPDADITTMVGPGGDPHTYQPTTRDIEKMQDADLVLWNGLHLEAQMVDQLSSLGEKQLAVGEQLDTADLLPWPEQGDKGEKLYDPHIWNSPELWSQVVDHIGTKLGEIDSDNAEDYAAAADAYEDKIAAAHDKAAKELESASPRVLITGHDAFNYFGKTFDFEVQATDFVTTEATKSATEISELADTIAEKKVPVIFQDNQANPQAITSLKEAVETRNWTVTISDEELFADTLGPEAPTDTYLGAFEHNASAVAKALS
ncbi:MULTISPECIES: metal ABC transporter substrate-binding protein [Corynebacterium]|uniref:Manganese ABC transporter substrate-binding lipoprotein n=1 Tax=Corynebacterium minutissimum TaxID=38301 RepID=A0A376CT92_9CORY|nr:MULTISPECIES: zinc ABC transporter substrate-binding protein [Corynebacterium]MCG7230439.1 zinc ABC transporter substrate-binding protein [Corynebacterium minutissimum]MCG7237392.1 zinc ABC transporter substrate-binding protein [Corynebacterium minutissimum]OFT60150.1 iron ABC transporter substrate-binding protein [Corynebacterium sp. HMSC05E07]QRP60050.1 zinc ABC transporter substrate-binding protein [Corynebacterium minutissimum]STC74350.1 manganese ABC transporter substrate-binding lipop